MTYYDFPIEMENYPVIQLTEGKSHFACECLFAMGKAGSIAEVNRQRNALAWELEELLPCESGGESFPGGFAYSKQCRGKHFNWKHVASQGTGNNGFLAPIQAKTELAREINKLSRDLMAVLLPELDVSTLLNAGGLFFEPKLERWVHECDLETITVASKLFRGNPSWKVINAVKELGVELPDTSAPRIWRAVHTLARAYQVKQSQAKKEA